MKKIFSNFFVQNFFHGKALATLGSNLDVMNERSRLNLGSPIRYSSFAIRGFLFVVSCLLFVAPSIANAGTLGLPPNNLGLVAYWPLNEGSGTVTADASGKGNTGTLVNGPTWAKAKSGRGVVFDGGTDVVTIPAQDTLFTENGAITISAWIYARSYGGGGLGRIVDRSTTVDGPCFQFVTGKLYFQIDGATDLIRSGGATIPLNQWVHVVATWDGSTTASNVKFYINGSEDSYVTTTNGVSINDNSSATFRIGNSASGIRGFDGTMDEVRIYNRVLTGAEILSLYKNSQQYFVNTSLSNTGLVGYWSLNDSNGSIATDFSGKGNHGVLTSSPTWVDGKFGKALRFSGSNYVSINDNPTIRPTSITVSAWIRANSVTTGVRAGFVSKWFLSGVWGYSMETGLASCDAGAGDGSRTGIKFMFRSTAVGTDTCAFSNLSEIPGKWQHVVGTFNESSGDAKIYIDGVLISTVDKTAGTLHQPLSPLGIGAINDNSSWGKNFDGTIDEVRIYNRALSDAEVATLYSKTQNLIINKSVAGITNGLIGWWTFDGGDSNWSTGSLLDKSTQGNNASFSGLSTSTTPTAGKIGQAFRFYGVSNQRASIGLNKINVALSGASGQTVSLWVKYKSLVSTNGDQNVVFTNAINGAGSNGSYLNVKGDAGNVGKIQFIARSQSGDTLQRKSSTGSISPDTWSHIVGVADFPNDVVRIYINGVLDGGSQATTFGSDTYVSGTPSSGLDSIGADLFGASGFNGEVDDLRIYRRALSDAEIKSLYTLGR